MTGDLRIELVLGIPCGPELLGLQASKATWACVAGVADLSGTTRRIYRNPCNILAVLNPKP